MKIGTKDLRETQILDLKGDEPWLGDIYASFEGMEEALHGKLSVNPAAYGVYAVDGHISYTPKVECARCQEAVPFAIERDISVRFIDRDAAEASFEIEGEEADEDYERELVSEDLDTYYVDAGGELDIEMVINDFVQTALPTRVTCEVVGRSCGLSLQNSESGLVHKDKSDFETSPFAALKNLKLPDA